MKIAGSVKDVSTKEPLNGASVTLVDNDLKPLGIGVASDASGMFILDSDKISPDSLIMFSYVDYAPYTIKAKEVSGNIYIARMGEILGQVVVTFRKHKKILLLSLISAAVIVLLFYGYKYISKKQI